MSGFRGRVLERWDVRMSGPLEQMRGAFHPPFLALDVRHLASITYVQRVMAAGLLAFLRRRRVYVCPWCIIVTRGGPDGEHGWDSAQSGPGALSDLFQFFRLA